MLSPQEIVETLRIPLVGIVPEDEAVLVAGSRGAPLDHGWRSLAGRAFHNMARRLWGENVSFDPILKGRRSLVSLFGLRRRQR